ncbi:MAG TPA: gamma-glutamyl-gamma-aminobutyrate hydrolase family protein, partial [Candidatus Paceibacterota bacterium]
MKSLQVLVVNFRSQYTDLIGRSLRDLGVRSAILPPERADKWFAKERPQAVILSGSDKSVNDADAPDISDAILNSGVPIFGICYGMQLLAKKFGGEVQSGTGEGNFGQTIITFNSGNEDGGLWYGLWNSGDNRHVVHASHGDVVTRIPLDFKRIAKPNAFHRGCMGMADLKRKIWGVQFHPEVEDTIDGKRMLSNFVFKIAGCEKDWSPRNLAEEIRETTIEAIGDRKAIVGFSGGVDSTSVTALLSKVLEKRLEAFIIDGGNLREREMEKIVRHAWATGITEPPLVVRAADKFVPAIAASIHAEEKRKAFRLVYQNILLTEARR